MAKPILFMFGGISAEHEVSVVTGLQALEHVPTDLYTPLPIYITKSGELVALPDLTSRKQFYTASRKPFSFGRDSMGGYILLEGLGKKKIYPHAAYLAFHGGNGEGGAVQGMLDTLGIPYSSSGLEGSVSVMNKRLAKEVLRHEGVSVVPDVRVFAKDIKGDASGARKQAVEKFGLPLIVKPVHLGSSVGITVAHTDIELEKGLLSAAFMDSEILIEPFLKGITEFNCAVRLKDGTIEVSEIERPVSHDEILSFADKYERGAKKAGAGMASLTRELPARIEESLKNEIQTMARDAFTALRLKGMARIDFMRDETGALYLTEVNSIPGSMAFYLWEASGIPFSTQIEDMIEESVRDAAATQHQLNYESDIIKRFVEG